MCAVTCFAVDVFVCETEEMGVASKCIILFLSEMGAKWLDHHSSFSLSLSLSPTTFDVFCFVFIRLALMVNGITNDLMICLPSLRDCCLTPYANAVYTSCMYEVTSSNQTGPKMVFALLSLLFRYTIFMGWNSSMLYGNNNGGEVKGKMNVCHWRCCFLYYHCSIHFVTAWICLFVCTFKSRQPSHHRSNKKFVSHLFVFSKTFGSSTNGTVEYLH